MSTNGTDNCRRLLGILYDKWENGADCYEDPESYDGWLGMAFKIDVELEDEILAALGRARLNVNEGRTS